MDVICAKLLCHKLCAAVQYFCVHVVSSSLSSCDPLEGLKPLVKNHCTDDDAVTVVIFCKTKQIPSDGPV